MEHENGIFYAARHRSELVERPAESHGSRSRYPAISRAKAGDSATRARGNDASAGLASNGKPNQSGGDGSAGAGARAGRSFFEKPGIHRLSAEPCVVEGECAKTQLGNKHRAGIVQSFGYGCIFGGCAIPEGLGAVGCWNSCGVEKIFGAPRDSVQRPAIFAGSNLLVRLPGLPECQFGSKRDDALYFGIELPQAREIDLRKTL